MLSNLFKKLLYRSGALGLYHRIRNARTLTVIMFHRILEPSDPRWADCDPDYTLRADLFERCLEFFAANYNTVSLGDVLRARRGETVLPSRALLITFDDGWADNVEYALPRLQARGMPAVMFVAADAVDRVEPFWQERIVAAWRRGRLTTDALSAALSSALGSIDTSSPLPGDGLRGLRRLIARLESLDAVARARVLGAIDPLLGEAQRQMVRQDELASLEHGGIALGLHGKSHVPMTSAQDLDAELAGARAQLAELLAHREPPPTMSFPHGKFDARVVERAHAAGYELLFTSVPVMNPTDRRIGAVLGRLGFETDAVADPRGRFRPEWLAMYLYRRSRAGLAG